MNMTAGLPVLEIHDRLSLQNGMYFVHYYVERRIYLWKKNVCLPQKN